MKGLKVLRKMLCLYQKGINKGVIARYVRRLMLSTLRRNYMSFDGPVTLILRVVARQTYSDQWIFKKTSTPTFSC
jgi:hypothetical protein